MAPLPVDLTRTYDAVIVGSGAAGGMAAHVLTSHGREVLMLEAGRKLNVEQELRSMEWPFEHPTRGLMPADSRVLGYNEYTVRHPPYGPGLEKYKHLSSWVGNAYTRNILVEERDHPYTGT